MLSTRGQYVFIDKLEDREPRVGILSTIWQDGLWIVWLTICKSLPSRLCVAICFVKTVESPPSLWQIQFSLSRCIGFFGLSKHCVDRSQGPMSHHHWCDAAAKCAKPESKVFVARFTSCTAVSVEASNIVVHSGHHVNLARTESVSTAKSGR